MQITVLSAAFAREEAVSGGQAVDSLALGAQSNTRDVSSYCGERWQKIQGGKDAEGMTWCGRAVASMVRCYVEKYTPDNQACLNTMASCGDGRNWIDCQTGFLTKCGFVRVDGSSPQCQQPGAVRAYYSSSTENGLNFGHVEYVCGTKYCSVYSEPLAGPWPQGKVDKMGRPTDVKSCWVPSTDVFGTAAAWVPPTPLTTSPSPRKGAGAGYNEFEDPWDGERERETPLGKAAEVAGAVAAKMAAKALKQKPDRGDRPRQLGTWNVPKEESESKTGEDGSIFDLASEKAKPKKSARKPAASKNKKEKSR